MRATVVSGRHDGERGAALVVALVFATAIAAAAVSFVEARQSDGLALRAQTQAVEAEAMLESALQQTAALLANRTGRQQIPRQLAWRFGATEVRVRLEPENGKVDLNAAEEPLLQALLLALNLDDKRATAFAQTVLDWRDENPTRRTAGAEDRDYDLDEQGSSGAADRPFAHPAELRYLAPVDRLLWARLEPLVTVYSGAATPNRVQASETVRRALGIARGLAPGSEQADAEQTSGEQTGLGQTGADRGTPYGAGQARALATSPEPRAGTAATPSGSSFTQEAGRLSGQGAGTSAARAGTGVGRVGTTDAGSAESGADEGDATTGDSAGVQAVFLDVRFPNGYEAAARAVIGFDQGGGAQAMPFTVLDWTPILRERSGTTP